jgi:hypothetical protein
MGGTQSRDPVAAMAGSSLTNSQICQLVAKSLAVALEREPTTDDWIAVAKAVAERAEKGTKRELFRRVDLLDEPALACFYEPNPPAVVCDYKVEHRPMIMQTSVTEGDTHVDCNIHYYPGRPDITVRRTTVKGVFHSFSITSE